jgi:uncharacterized protein (TIGR00661 family)
MRILFLVQGEGRGHMTQAIALRQILHRANHEVVGALVGTALDRNIPSFFNEQIQVPVHHFHAPQIIYKTNGSGMNLKGTLTSLFTGLPRYVKALKDIHQTITKIQPDVIVSFYETYGGIYNVVFQSKIPMICVAHQYLLLHPNFTFPENNRLNRILINLNSQATSWLSVQRLALSFRRFESAGDLKIKVVPPLLRKEVIELKATNGDFFLVYMTHHSLSQEIITWHNEHPEVKLHCFWDNVHAADVLKYDETLTFHRINSSKYLQMLSSCRALVTTAGFESVCEAMYLGKPVMMVPVPNHFEQQCNALDGVISGAGIRSEKFNLSLLLSYLPDHKDQSEKFKNWYENGEAMFVEQIEKFGPKKNSLDKPAALTVAQ